MVIPNHLLCMITGEVMKHPVMIESGQSYERDAIIRYFEIQKQRAESDKHDMGEDFDDNEYRSYFKCPATQQRVSPEKVEEFVGAEVWMIENTQLKTTIKDFLTENPWAFEFDPRQQFQDMKVWDRQHNQ